MSKLPIAEADLQAYVDDLLPEPRRAEVEAYLASAPEEAQRLRAYREQNAAIRSAYRYVLDEPTPERFTRRTRTHRWPRYAAIVAWLFAGGSAGWMVRGELGPAPVTTERPGGSVASARLESLPRQAAVAHVVYSPDVRRPVEIGADDEDQLIAWLSKRLATEVKPPKLGDLGYELIGGRLLPGARGPVAQFMYHDVTGQRITVYVSAEIGGSNDAGFRYAQEGPVNVYYWLDRKFGYAISAGIDKGELGRIAAEIHRQVSA